MTSKTKWGGAGGGVYNGSFRARVGLAEEEEEEADDSLAPLSGALVSVHCSSFPGEDRVDGEQTGL